MTLGYVLREQNEQPREYRHTHTAAPCRKVANCARERVATVALLLCMLQWTFKVNGAHESGLKLHGWFARAAVATATKSGRGYLYINKRRVTMPSMCPPPSPNLSVFTF
jgi:DNA mismatch repair ATPase MutL